MCGEHDLRNKSSAAAEMGDRLTTIDTGRKVGVGCCAPNRGGSWVSTEKQKKSKVNRMIHWQERIFFAALQGNFTMTTHQNTSESCLVEFLTGVRLNGTNCSLSTSLHDSKNSKSEMNKCISEGLMHVAAWYCMTPRPKFTKFSEYMSIGQTPNIAKFCHTPTKKVRDIHCGKFVLP